MSNAGSQNITQESGTNELPGQKPSGQENDGYIILDKSSPADIAEMLESIVKQMKLCGIKSVSKNNDAQGGVLLWIPGLRYLHDDEAVYEWRDPGCGCDQNAPTALEAQPA